MPLPANAKFPAARTPQGPGLRVCERHLRQPATPKDHAEALAYLRHRLARYNRFWVDPERADSLELHGTYDITAFRMVLEASPEPRAGGYRPGGRK